MRIKKFQFSDFAVTHDSAGNDFSQNWLAAPAIQAPEAEPLPQEVTYTESELEARSSAAYLQGIEEGREIGYSEAREEDTVNLKAASAAQVAILERLNQHYAEYEKLIQLDTYAIAKIIASAIGKILDESAGAKAKDIALKELSGYLRYLNGVPKLFISAHPSLCADLESRFNQLKDENGFTGEVVIKGDDNVQPGDIKLQWATGKLERSSMKIAQEIEEIVKKAFGRMENTDHET